MGFGEFVKNLKNGLSRVEPENVRAREDKVLEGLRRQRQRQLDEEEKKYLKVEIANYEKDRTRKDLYGAKKMPRRKQFKRPPRNVSYYGRGDLL